MSKIQLGPIQKEWVKQLREHPERQITAMLGKKIGNTEYDYMACCLGEGLCVLRRRKNKPLFNRNGRIVDDGSFGSLIKSYSELGLRDPKGSVFGGIFFSSLESANDYGVSWSEIAEFIEQNPEAVFTKSV